MRIDPEGGLELVEGEAQISRKALPNMEGEDVKGLVQRILAGELPRPRALAAYEPQRLSMLHINMIFDRALGFKPSEIAEKYDIRPNVVSIILHHPDSEALLSFIAAEMAERIMDPVERIKAYAHEAITVKAEIMSNRSVHPAIRDKVASDMLDRAGYGARRHLDINARHAHEIVVPTKQAGDLAEALSESKRLRDVDYTQYTRVAEVQPSDEDELDPSDVEVLQDGDPNSDEAAA